MKWSHRLSASAISTRENSAVSTKAFSKVAGNILSPGFVFDKKKKEVAYLECQVLKTSQW